LLILSALNPVDWRRHLVKRVEAAKNEAVKILYLASLPVSLLHGTVVAERPLSRSLVRHLATQHELRVRGAIAPAELPAFQDGVISADELAEFDAVFMEGGWNRPYKNRFPLELAEAYVRGGGQLIVADASYLGANVMQGPLEEAAHLFGASFQFRKVAGRSEVSPS
jgi:hypothetical protein